MTAAPTTGTAGRPADTEPDVIRNPVLPGFHPDPSLLRVGADYYLATSTFEWLPGVTVHHSTDLVNWRSHGGVLREPRLIDPSGNPDSGGVWAPCLSYADGLFHLVYSDVKSFAGAFKDVRNFVTVAPSLDGPWSDPVPLPGHGFDPSLFHDTGPDGDGRSWLLWVDWDHRPGTNPFAGILLQEYDRALRRVVGPVHRIFTGTSLGCTEGPHLYRRGGWYYLVTAEGGTSWDHAVTVARSRSLRGPFTPDPGGPLLTSAHRPELELQKAGHASLVDTPEGDWYLAHLAARPLTSRGACVLGRETALQQVDWTADGWPRVAGPAPEGTPSLLVPAPPAAAERPASRVPEPPEANPDGFGAGSVLAPQWMTLRRHEDPSWLSLTRRTGWLRLRGGESLSSRHRQSLVARRQQHTRFDFRVTVSARPGSPRQMAGLVHLYNTELWHYLHLTWDEDLGRVLRVALCDRGKYSEAAAPTPVGPGLVVLRLAVRDDQARFQWALWDLGRCEEWFPIGPLLDSGRLSDEYATVGDPATGHYSSWGFTGAFVGVCAQDLTGSGWQADFAAPAYHEAGDGSGPDGPDLLPPASMEPRA
ncbi:glycoside hydrolase family 43 protein [Streptomyces sp. NPDC059168]|uniref:glycoside hydrolase family 43 protein n=1 Tax=Streptomyces sp. NPDC059168 TaxID=3346753 RepID=UPI00368EE790